MIAHCPISNAYFANAVLPLSDALARGARVGLATDIGAGVRVGVFQQIHDAVTFSRIRQDGVDARKDPDARGVPPEQRRHQIGVHRLGDGPISEARLQRERVGEQPLVEREIERRAVLLPLRRMEVQVDEPRSQHLVLAEHPVID
ncbi:MAG: hypothetical protein EBZ17_12325 [Actinobacteria bacterium]|nr:hypothetical protein [Actinomycetota bacterium]